MDTSSSDDLTSDEEIEKEIDSAWTKTKLALMESENESESDEDIQFSTTVSRLTSLNTKNDSEGLLSSSSFILDKKPSQSVNEMKNERIKLGNKHECDHGDQKSTQSDSSENEGEVEDQPSLFVLDKQPSLINTMKSLTVPHNDGKTKKNSMKKEGTPSKKKVQKNNTSLELSSSLKVKWDPSNIYINLHSKHAPQPKYGTPIERISKEADEIMKKSVVTPDFEKRESVPSYEEEARQKRKERKKEREKSKGKGWYNMPKGEVNDETKNDLLALKMRRALDPKRFYKGDDIKGMPKYFQFGTVVEDASEFYSSRIPKKQRKKSMVEELMADAEFRKYNKRKYSEIQDLKAKGLGPYQGVRTMRIKKKKKK